jgi:hypothetical protein
MVAGRNHLDADHADNFRCKFRIWSSRFGSLGSRQEGIFQNTLRHRANNAGTDGTRAMRVNGAERHDELVHSTSRNQSTRCRIASDCQIVKWLIKIPDVILHTFQASWS